MLDGKHLFTLENILKLSTSARKRGDVSGIDNIKTFRFLDFCIL